MLDSLHVEVHNSLQSLSESMLCHPSIALLPLLELLILKLGCADSHPGMNLAAVSSSDHALCTVYLHIDFLVTLVCVCSFCHIFLQLI
jgi:hypothetical protein